GLAEGGQLGDVVLGGPRVPDLDRAVDAEGRDAPAVVALDEGGDAADMALEQRARQDLEAPQLDRAVGRRGEDALAVAVEARDADTGAGEERRRGLAVPELHAPRAVEQDALAVRAEGDLLDALAEVERAQLVAVGGVEEAGPLIPARGRDALALRVEGR